MKETAKNLKKMAEFGVSEGISEMILTTRNAADSDSASDSKFNAAPFGITWKNNRLFLHLFKGSKTRENLLREDFFAANLTDDAVLFAESAFYDLKPENFEEIKSEQSAFTPPGTPILVPVLKNADRFIIFKCVSRFEEAGSTVIDIEPVDFGILNPEKAGFVFNRGFHSVIEACIHLTRYELTKDTAFIEYIRHHQKIIQRCGRKQDKNGFSIVRRRLMEIEEESRK